MADPKKIENAIRRVRNQKSFIQDLLIDALGWDIHQRADDIEEISFEWSAEELRANELDKHIVDGTIRQIRPFKGNPWGIFILEFRNPDVFATGRGMTGPLRNVLRGLVPSKKKKSSLKSFGHENLLFICNHDYKHYRFAHFKAPDKNSQTAPLAAFGWGPDDPIRTLCEFNLSALEWPDGQPDAAGWVAAWSQAFDVEKVTRRFYEDYAAVFAKVENLIGKQKELSGDDLRMFTQTLFNRLMFLRFMERKNWLSFGGQKNYLRALYAAGGYGKKTFYRGRLCPLFFEGLAEEGREQNEAYGQVPYLNGGLFERSELDKRVTDLPDEVFSGILANENAGGLFYRYNFTVEESTPLDIEVAVDPEMLGKVFEELVTGRHESGSYYTPRPVVSFMCREALKGYLADKLTVSGTLRVPPASGTRSVPDTVAALVDSHDVSKLKETHAREILTALDDLKAVDPACGSGAYLLGLLQELVLLYRSLYSEKLVKDARSLYDLKLRIISQSLYGVDIDPFATNIARLRLWLSLAVEADKPVPLPNLDFKIETGDSLLAPDPHEMPDLFRGLLQASADVLAMVKNQFFLSHGEEKEEYRKTIISQEAYLRKELAAEYGEGVVDWRIQFAEAFANKRGGFDIVLANPPYVRMELLKGIKPILEATYPEVYVGGADLYCYFYARAFQLLRRGGLLSFITSNKWFKASYGERLRRHFAENAWMDSVVDFGHAKQIFPGADVFPCIVVARRPDRRSPPASVRVCSIPREQLRIDDLSRQVRDQGVELPLSQLGAGVWHLEPMSVNRLLTKIRAGGIPLAEFAGVESYRGVTTGLNEAFLIDSSTRNRLVKSDPKSSEIIRPYLRGQDIDRWAPNWAGLWMIFARRGVEIDRYPAIKEHLRQFRDKLEPKPLDHEGDWHGRKPGSYKWYEIQDTTEYWQEFAKPKIMYAEITWRAQWSTDANGTLASNTVYFITCDDLWILGAVNAPISWWYAWRQAVHGKDEALRFIGVFVRDFPIPRPTDAQRACAVRAVRRLIEIAGKQQMACHELLDWLRVEHEVEKPTMKLQSPIGLDCDVFVAEVRKARRKKSPLSEAALANLREEYARSIAPARVLATEALTLENEVSGVVNQAYGLTAEEVALMWQTAPPRMPIAAPELTPGI